MTKHIALLVALTLTMSAQPLVTTIQKGQYTSSTWGVLHGAANDTSQILGWKGALYSDVMWSFSLDSVEGYMCVIPLFDNAEMKVDTLCYITYLDSLTRHADDNGESGLLTVGTKYRYTKGNSDSLVIKRPGLGYAGQKLTATGDITITDSTAFLIFGDTIGAKFQAHTSTPAVRRVFYATMTAAGYTAYRVMWMPTARTGKEGTYRVAVREY